ncbi:unnamed protein product [Withania somnifera]
MLGRRFISFLRRAPSPIVSGTFICLTGGIALSALDDLSIYHSCSSKALEKASKNKKIVDAIGEPIARGPWYNASLAVAHQRHSVSCTFLVSGPKALGFFKDKWSSFFGPSDWEILIMEALIHVGNEEKQQTFRIKVSDDLLPPASSTCTDCTSQESLSNVDKK